MPRPRRRDSLPGVLDPVLRKHSAPLLMYKWSSENGMPFRFDSKGKQRSTKRAYKSKDMEDYQDRIIDSSKIFVVNINSVNHTGNYQFPNIYPESEEAQLFFQDKHINYRT